MTPLFDTLNRQTLLYATMHVQLLTKSRLGVVTGEASSQEIIVMYINPNLTFIRSRQHLRRLLWHIRSH